MDVLRLEEEVNKNFIITREDFPFICRICCLKRSDLRLFEDYLLDLFYAIRKINVHSTADLPRNICNECIIKLEDMSLFIDISKYNDASFVRNVTPKEELNKYTDDIGGGMAQYCMETTKKSDEDMSSQESQTCRLCFSSASNLIPFKEKIHLMELFQNITNIDVEAQSNSSKINSICHKCNNELEKISSFIGSSVCNDQKLENAICKNGSVKTEVNSDSTDVEKSTCQDLKLGNTIDGNEALNENTSREIVCFEGNENTLETTDITKEINDGELSSFTKQNNQNQAEFHPRAFPEEKPFEGTLLRTILQAESFKQMRNVDHELHPTSEKKSFKCDCCKNSFISKENLMKHMLIHIGEKPFKCDICERSFTETRYLQQHKLTHNGEKPFRCDRCHKSYTEKRNLEKHLFNKHGKKPFICKSCGKSFYLKSNLKRHTLTDHGGKLYKCDCCEKSFKRNAHLKQHLVIHSGEKPFKCDCCDKSFSQKASLNHHKLTLNREKPFKCGCCDIGFAKESSLRSHLLALSREKRFQCDCCEKRFSQKFDLKQHLLTHTEDKPFKCDWCEKYFTEKRKLKRHLLIHTKTILSLNQ